MRTDEAADPARPAISRRLLVGTTVAAALAAALAALTQAAVVPPLTTADETAHIDYAFQVWRGDLPVFEEGLVLEPAFGVSPPVQWTAQHPPAYYALLAPVVGPLVEADRVLEAVYSARLVNVVLTGLLVVAAAWVARALPAGAGPLVPLVPVITAGTAWVARVGGSAYNDTLTALLVTLLLGVALRAVRGGLSPGLVVAVTVLDTLALLTRASTVVPVALLTGWVVVTELARRRQVAAAVVLAVASPLVALAGAGWFYVRNLRLTGSFTGGHPEWAQDNLGRVTRSLGSLLLDPAEWLDLISLYSYSAGDKLVTTSTLFLLPALLALLATVAAWRSRRSGRPDGDSPVGLGAAVPALLGCLIGATVMMQFVYGTTGGALNPRYLLPVVVPVAVLVGRGLSVSRSAPLLLVWGAVALTAFVVWATSARSAHPGLAANLGAVAMGATVIAWCVAGGLSLVDARRLWRSPERSDATSGTSGGIG